MSRPTPDELRKWLRYDKRTGVITWRADRPPNKLAGKRAGNPWEGRWTVRFNSADYPAAVLAFVLVEGRWPLPDHVVDHKDCDCSNDRWNNLRELHKNLNAQNKRNALNSSKTGLLGVWSKPDGKFTPKIQVGGRALYFGTFSDPEPAHLMYLLMKPEVHRAFHV